MQKWKSKLTRIEREHINICGLKTKADLAEIFKYQRKLRLQTDPRVDEPCLICKSVAVRLGYPVE
jgi:hypothetical protein